MGFLTASQIRLQILAAEAPPPSEAPEPGNVPVPTGVQPPGTEGLLTVLNWTSWIVTVACVFGVLVVAGMMAISHRRGQGSEAIGNLGWVMGACVLVASASQLVNVLI